MDFTPKTAPLNVFNVGLNNLHNNLNDVIKTNKYNSYSNGIKSTNKQILDSDLTTEYKTSSNYTIETTPYLTDYIVNNLISIGTVIYNKKTWTNHCYLILSILLLITIWSIAITIKTPIISIVLVNLICFSALINHVY